MDRQETLMLSDEAPAENHLRPPDGRLVSLFSDHQLREDLKILAPAIGSLFAVLIILRSEASGLVFWPAAVVGGCGVYAFLCRSGHRRQVTVDAYRTALIAGLALIVSSAVFNPMPLWPDPPATTVEVQRPAVNIRKEATTQSGVVIQAKQGDHLRVLDQTGSWYKVRTESGDTGCVYAKLVR